MPSMAMPVDAKRHHYPDFPVLDLVTLLPEHDSEMPPTNKERLDGLENRLGEIEIALGLKPPKPKSAFRQFREHLWQQIKTNKTTIIPIVAIIVAVAGWFASGWFRYYLDHRYDFIDGMISTNLSAKGGVKETLAAVQQTVNRTETTLATLQPFIQDVINHQFESTSKLSTAALQERLPAVQHLLASARDQRVKADTKVLDALTQKLSAANTSAVGFWPTAAEFISYRSALTHEDLVNLSNSMPKCTDQPPHLATVAQYTPAGSTSLSINPAYYENCQLQLDSREQDAYLSYWALKVVPTLTPLIFRHCLVTYNGGIVQLQLPGPLTFENSLWVFSISGIPPVSGQKVTEMLLVGNPDSFKFPAL